MNDLIKFSFKRVFAIVNKEMVKIKSDSSTLAIILTIPVLQIILFGYGVEFFPKHIPTAVVNYDESPYSRRFIQAIQTTTYFNLNHANATEEQAKQLFKEGKVNYIITIPPRFTKDLVRGNSPHILLEADASATGTMGGAVQAVQELQSNLFDRDLKGVLNYLETKPTPFIADIHPVYNPDLLSPNSMVPSLIGVILMLSLSTISCMTIIEEREAGNIEVLLNSHIRPLEIMIGKFIAYLFIGYIQMISVILISVYCLFNVPMRGSLLVYLVVSFPFIMGNLMMGIAASTIAQSPLQAQQLTGFFFLPSLLLSGFLFPFYGMPYWAQVIGNTLPLTHYIRISSGIMLKDYGWSNILPDLWPIIIFTIIVTAMAILTFKRTLD